MINGIVAGLVSGAAYAILAVCLVVLFRLTGVLNFGQAALGALGAYTCYAAVGAGLPLPLAVLAGLTAAGALAAVFGGVMARWFPEAGVTSRAMISVIILMVLLTLGFRIFGDSPRLMPSLVPTIVFEIGGVNVSLTTLVALAATSLIAGAIRLLLKYTRLGLQLEAMAERQTTLQLLGVNTPRLTMVVWAAAGTLSAFAMLLIAPTRNPTFESMSFLVVPALAAGLLGAFSRVWVAAVCGLAIGAVEGAGSRIPEISDLRGAVPLVVILTGLIWMRRREVWDAAR